MPLDFPNAPNVNDTFTSNGRSWKWNGTTWDLVPIAHTHALADLVDFTVASPATGQALVYNGTKWANSASIPQASISNLPADLATINSNVAGKVGTGTNVYSADFNTLITSGFYRFDVPSANGPGHAYGQLLVVKGPGDTIGQTTWDYGTGAMYTRSASGIGGSPVWTAWKRIGMITQSTAAPSGGSDGDVWLTYTP